ncbi:hypothetical protein [Myceligenerans cantabricum]
MARKTRLVQKSEKTEPEPVRELRPHPRVWKAALERVGGDASRLHAVEDLDAADGVTVVVLPDDSGS